MARLDELEARNTGHLRQFLGGETCAEVRRNWSRAREAARLPCVGILEPIQNTLATDQQLAAMNIYATAELAGESAQGDLVGGVAPGDVIVDLTATFVGVKVCLFDEIPDCGAQRLGEQLGVEAPQELEIEIDLHIEVVKAEVAEIAVEESVVGDLMESLRMRIQKTVIVTEGIPEEALFAQQLAFQPGAGIRFGAAEIEGILDVPLHEAEVDQDVAKHGVGLEHEQVVGYVHVEVIQNAESVQDLRNRVLAVEVSKTALGAVLHAEKDTEQAEFVEDADGLLGDAVGPSLHGDGDSSDTIGAETVADGSETLGCLHRIGEKEIVVLQIEYADAVVVIQVAHFGNDVFDAADPELLPAAPLIPGVNAAKGALAPAAAAGQNAGYGLIEVGVERRALRPRKFVELVRVPNGRVGARVPAEVAITKTGYAAEIIEIFG